MRGFSTAFFRRPALYCSLSTALLWWLSGAFNIPPLGWVALFPFFYFLFNPELKRRFRFGWTTGFFCFFLVNWWIIPTITRGAPSINAPWLLGLFLGFVAVTIIAVVHAFQVGIVAWQSVRKPLWTPLWCALLWTGLDAMRTVSSIAHGWGALAFSQSRDLPILQNAALFGQHGLTFACAFVAASLAMGVRTRAKVHFVAPAVLLVAMHLYGAVVLVINPRIQNGPTVLLVQTNVSSVVKSGNESGESPFSQAFRLTNAVTRTRKVDLVVWPETTADFRTAPPFAGNQTRDLRGLDWSQLTLLGPKNTAFLIGAQERFQGPDGDARRNDAVLINPGHPTQGRAKERLVPFGERAPFVEWLPFLAILSPRPECLPGTGENALPWKEGKIAPVVCFESCFPEPAKRLCRDANLLAVITNDELFWGTEAPLQHAQMAILRAVENGVPMVQSTNGGVSLACDAQGRTLADIPYGKIGAVAVRLP